MKSNKKSQVDGQAELEFDLRAEPNFMPMEIVRAQKDKGGAFTLACVSSTLLDKQIYGHSRLKIDPGYFSKMKAGLASLDLDQLADFCYVVNNTIFADWLAWKMGCTLMMVKSEAEKRIDELMEENAKLKTEKRVLIDAMHGRVSP
jgi:hypothetical protein